MENSLSSQRRVPMPRRHHAIVALCCLPVLTALAAGCDEEEKATPQIIFESRLAQAPGTNCKDSGELFRVGEFGNSALQQPPKPIKDGEAYEQGSVSVSCSVTPAGPDAFNVAGTVALSGATGGLFRVDGTFKPTGEQTGIHAIFSSRRSTNTYEQTDRACIVRYTTGFQGVAAGRVWGEITCPNAENPSAQTSCQATAQFRFENCAQ